MLNRSFSEIKDPECTHCGNPGGERLISKVTVITSMQDFMGGMPSWESMTDFDEDDPRSAADMLRRMKDNTGEDIGPEGGRLKTATLVFNQGSISIQYLPIDAIIVLRIPYFTKPIS